LILLQFPDQLYLTIYYLSNSIVNAIVFFVNIVIIYFVQLTACLLILLVFSNSVTVINLPKKLEVKQFVPISKDMLLTGGTVLPLFV